MHLGTETLLGRKGEDMSALRRLRNFWILWVTTVVLACFSNAVAQTSYRVTDLGTLHDGYFGCTMGVNDHGWTETQYGLLESGKLLKGRVAINVNGFTLDLGTLGGPNSWDNPFGGEINDRGEAVGYSETSVPDPDGEDVCGFGTHLTCRPFLWQNFHMSALPMLGGNNGQASAMNNRGQITGFAETTVSDSSCPASSPSKIHSPVIWKDGKARALPTVGSDPDGEANGINDKGQAVGSSGTCTAGLHAVLWEKNGTASSLPDLGTAGAAAFGINNQGQIVGLVPSPDGTTFYAALWQNGEITKLGAGTLPGDFAAIASGINNKGQVVGSTLDSTFNFDARAFIWQDNVMTDLSTLFPASSNLYPTMANQINERGQIVGMATVLSGPHEGETHAFLATPVDERINKSIADVAPTHPKSNLPTNVGKQLLQRFGRGRFDQ
jgi:probable HAF family extracellular repeat protein